MIVLDKASGFREHSNMGSINAMTYSIIKGVLLLNGMPSACQV